jgi:hypothetical protein
MILMFIWFKELRYQIGAFQWITKWSWQNLKMSITMGVYLTCRAGGPNPRLSGPRGQPVGPTPWLVSQGLSRLGPGLGWDVSMLVHKEGSETWRWWRPRGVAGRPHGWPVSRPFARNRPCQVGGGSTLPLYKPCYGWRLNNTYYM